MNRRNILLALGVVGFCTGSDLFAADEPFNGTWKLNAAKSNFTPGPGPQDETVTITGEHGMHTVKFQIKTAQGETIEGDYTAKSDGTPAPLTGSPLADTISVRKINDRTVERRLMKAGKTVGQDRGTLSPDGKTLTITGSALSPRGTQTKFSVVFEKQP